MSKSANWLGELSQWDDTYPDDQALASLAVSAGTALGDRKLLCGTAESCTGGLVAKLITDVAGSSDWFECGYVTYSNRAKHQMLGVPDNLFNTVGAVSQEVVLALADSVIKRGNVQLSTAISGVAGPAGGTPDKPVGTVWIAWAHTDRLCHAILYQFDGDRDRIRRLAAGAALRGMIAMIKNV